MSYCCFLTLKSCNTDAKEISSLKTGGSHGVSGKSASWNCLRDEGVIGRAVGSSVQALSLRHPMGHSNHVISFVADSVASAAHQLRPSILLHSLLLTNGTPMSANTNGPFLGQLNMAE